jgi:large subunit ribosomal protein L32
VPNPKRKFSRARRDHRRANWKLTAPTLVRCNKPDCDGMHLSHHVCPQCGTYGPEHRQVLAMSREA